MTLRTLISRSLRFHWRSHCGVLLGAAVGSAALIGALVVGDSVRLSLRELALQRLGWVDTAMAPRDRFFTQTLDERIASRWAAPYSQHSVALRLPGTVARQDGTARANHVTVLGVRPDFWPETSRARFNAMPARTAILNEALATHLNAKPGDELVLRLHKPSALSRDVPITPQSDSSIALRVRVHRLATAGEMGNFNLRSGQTPPFNLFMSIEDLAAAAGVPNQANLYLSGMPGLPRLSPAAVTKEVLPGQSLTWQERVGLDWFNRTPTRVRAMIQDSPRSTLLSDVFNRNLSRSNSLPDFQLSLRTLTNLAQVELITSRIFLEPQVTSAVLQPVATEKDLSQEVPVYADTTSTLVDPIRFRQNLATHAQPILTYLVNRLRTGNRSVPYSMVTAAGSPWTPPDMKDDEILVNRWLADDMNVKVGDRLDLTYFLAESGANLIERTNVFRVRGIVPMDGVHGDRTLMPEFPGLAKAESTQEWDAGFPLVHKIRDEDEAYWKKYRGTPKAFVTLAAGQAMWANRFGNLTAIRFPVPANRDSRTVAAAVETALLSGIDPASLGLRFEPVRAQALAGASQSQDFGGLFIGFSFFLILAALILMALLFQFGVEQRTNEIGTLLALGFAPARVRTLLLGEGVAIAFVGGLLGMLGGVGYAHAMLYGLATLWRDAVGTSALRFHTTSTTLVIGLFASVIVSAITIWIVLRKQARRPARELLAEGAGDSPLASTPHRRGGIARWIALGSGAVAAGLIGWAILGDAGASAELFFSAGGLLLIAGLAAVAILLSALERSGAGHRPTIASMGLRNGTRRRSRSLASVALLACGSFLVASIGANRLEAGRDATKRSSGTGGFALFGESTLPVVRDLNTKAGRDFYSLDDQAMQGVSVVPFRVRDGDDASCLNLNRAQTPRLLGVKPELLAQRKAFTFASILDGSVQADPWLTLKQGEFYPKDGEPLAPDEIAAIGDAASIQWALGKKLGDTIEYTDERGQTFKVRLVAGVANSILQGNLIIDEAEFVKHFPGESGHRMFLFDVPSNPDASTGGLKKTSADLSRALQDVGLELTPATDRLEAFNAVQNTYLNTFQILGGLGLLLGSAGLGVVVLRNVLERRSELGLLQAVGFRRRSLRWLVLSEHGGLLALGLTVGIAAAVAAVLPALLAPGAETHYVALFATLGAVFLSGLTWTWVATGLALRGELLKALRNE